MAKELAMIENNEQGRKVRRYFIACEKKQSAALSLQARLAAPVPTFANRRWMIVVAPDGSETARPLDPEHFLSKIDELPKLLGDPEFRINNPQLINIILVCTSRLAAELAGKAHREYA